MRIIRTERGWAAHFCCAQWCRFRRNTLLEHGDSRVVISSVGDYHRPIHGEETKGPEEVGLDRYYETMAFEAMREAPYWEADIGEQLSFESEWALEEHGRGSDLPANAMHEAVVAECIKKMHRGWPKNRKEPGDGTQ